MQPVNPADDARVIALLWRSRTARGPRRGRPARIDTDQVVAAAIELAGAGGVDAVTMRGIAARLGTAPMTLYGHVPDKDALIALMHDAALLGMPVSEPPAGSSWRERLVLVAGDNRALLRAHPWLLDVRPERRWIGPGLLAKHEWELSAFDGLGLSARTVESSLGFLVEFVRATVREERAGASGHPPAEVWAQVTGPLLSRYATQAEFTLAARVLDPDDPDHAYRFGLDRVLDGITTLVPARFRVR